MGTGKRTIEVELSNEEIARAADIGRARSAVNDLYTDGAIDPHRSGIDIDIQGAIGEFAFAKHYKIAWTGRLWTRQEWEKRRGDGDIGPIQIKTIRDMNHRLIVPEKDAGLKNAPFVLVSLHSLPIATLVGWCMGSYIIQPRFWNISLPRAAWAVYPERLAPMSTFWLRFKNTLEAFQKEKESQVGHYSIP